MYYLIDVVNSNVAQEAFHFDDLDQEPDFGSWFTIVEASSKEEALRSEGVFPYKIREDTQMMKQYYNDHTELSQAQKQQIVDYLIANRMSNYGLPWREFKKMSAQRSRLRTMLRLADINKLNWENLPFSSFQFSEGEVYYIISKISKVKEEMTRLIQQLLSKNKN